MFRRLREGEETVGQHPRLRPFEYVYVDLDLLLPRGVGQAETRVDRLSNLRARFDNQFSNYGVRSFLQVYAEAGNGPMTEDAVPVRDDMHDARIRSRPCPFADVDSDPERDRLVSAPVLNRSPVCPGSDTREP